MEPKAPTCSQCEQVMERDFPAEYGRGRAANGYPYVTKNISGEAIEVLSPGHEAELCKIHGVVKRDDAAWLTKEHAGQDWRTGKPIYRESSGVGDPGCWI